VLYRIIFFIFFPLLKKIIISSIQGLENLPKNIPFIIAGNHISQLDPLVIIGILFPIYKKKVHFIANRGTYGPWIAKYITTNLAGCILVNPRNPGNECINIALSWLKKGDLVGIFPEAERVPEGTFLRRGKTGVARLAIRSGLPVLPIGIITTGEPHHKRGGRKFSKPQDIVTDFILKGKKIEIVIGKPISFKHYSEKSINNDLLHSITDQIMFHVSQLTNIPTTNKAHQFPNDSQSKNQTT